MTMVDNMLYPPSPLRIPPRTPRSSPSPLRSSKKRSQIFSDDADPLLGNLSPESILDALSAINAVPKHEKQAKDLLVKSISQVSNDERALGARAAIAAQKLREWLKEVQGWKWPVGKEIHQGKGFIPPSKSLADINQSRISTQSESTDTETGYLGSLPADVVVKHETRIEEIRDGMDSLDVEELKEHVLNVHIPSRSRPSSSNSAFSAISVAPPFTYVQLSDFSAVITATILRALPILSRLNILLNTWDVRLLVLRQIPGLVIALRVARANLDSSWSSLKDHSADSDLLTLDMFHSKKDELERKVLEAGRRMDRILDPLEGRNDSLPEAWVDDLEGIEADFGTWTVEAERRAVENEWKYYKAQQEQQKTIASDSSAETSRATQVSIPLEDVPEEDEGESVEPVTVNKSTPEEAVIPAESDNVSPVVDTTILETIISLATLDTKSTGPGVKPSLPHPVQEDEVSLQQMESQQAILSPASPSEPNAQGSSEDSPTQTAPSVALDNNEVPISSQTVDVEISSVSVKSILTFDGAADQASHSHFLDSVQHGSADLSATTRKHTLMNTKVVESSETELPFKTRDGLPVNHTPVSDKVVEPSETEHLSRTLDNMPVNESPGDESVMGPFEAVQRLETLDSVSVKDAQINNITTGPSEAEQLPQRLDNHTNAIDTEDVLEPPSVENLLKDQTTNSIPASNEDTHVVLLDEHPATTAKSEIVLSSVEPGDFLEASQDTQIDSVQVKEPESTIDVSLPESPVKLSPLPASRADSPTPERSTCEQVALEVAIVSQIEDPNITSLDPETVEQVPTTPKHTSPPRPIRLDLETGAAQPRLQSGWTELPMPHYSTDDSSPERGSDTQFPRSPTVEATTPELITNSSPDIRSLHSDRTMREGLSPRLVYRPLPNRHSFRHTKTASLPLQRFINDEIDANYGANEGFSSDMYGTPRRASDVTHGALVKNEQSRPPRKQSESPPLSVNPRPAIRQPLSSSTRGTVSSLNKAVAPVRKGNSKTLRPGTTRSDITDLRNSRSGLTASVNGNRSPAKNVSTARNPMLLRPIGDLRSKLSMESIGSFNSYSEAGDMDESFAMRPFNETDDDLHEKINSILTSIPARIRLGSIPAYDFDQQSTMSSISNSRRERLGSRSPYSTPSRSSTPTPSLTLMPASSRPRRNHPPTEEKTVRVYHLHQRGKAAPTKLFVRSVGEDGERVMVRVGGGWADLGEYLREYVLHHGRRAVSTKPDVQGLPVKGAQTSPGSILTATNENEQSPRSRPASVMSNRPGSALSVRKTRRPSKAASELPELTTENIEQASEYMPPTLDSTGRRMSVSSINSVSLSSVIGDGASVYSPFPGLARVPLQTSHSTPLGLAGPKPRTRHTSMSPESEAWVEGVIGQARRTSSSMKPQKLADSRAERDHHAASRTLRDQNQRSVSDIGTIGHNKRVSLRGLDKRSEQES